MVHAGYNAAICMQCIGWYIIYLLKPGCVGNGVGVQLLVVDWSSTRKEEI